MIKYIEGDLFSSPAQTIVNTVNTVGVMGKGVALAFKQRYPDMFKTYQRVCEENLLDIGKLMVWHGLDHWVLLFPTKKNWRNPSRIEYIEAGLRKFVDNYTFKGINSIAFPRLGCGNGGLNWQDVKPVMEKYLANLPIPVYIYTGNYIDPVAEHKNTEVTANWLKSNAIDMSFSGLRDELIAEYSIVPCNFYSSGNINEAKWYNGLVFMTNGVETYMSEDELFKFWDNVREMEVFTFSDLDSNNERLAADLLFSLGFFTRIRLISNTGEKSEGYQINSGLGRAYTALEMRA